MTDSAPRRQGSGVSRRGGGRDLVWMVLVWGRVTVGLVLAGVGGVAFGHAWTREYAPFWWVGAITLLAGCLLVLSGLYARSRPPGVTPEIAMQEAITEGGEPLVPLLGALLIYKYQRITQKALNEALERQHKEGENRRRIGQILLEMGAITPPQLDEALEFQRSVLREKTAKQAEGV